MDSTAVSHSAGKGPDIAGRRLVAICRMLLASGVAALASTGVLAVPDWLAWLIGLVWVPTTAVLWFAIESRGRAVDRLGTAIDLMVLLIAMRALPDSADTIILLGLVLVAIMAYHEGALAGVIAAAAIIGARTSMDAIAPVDRGVVAVVAVVAILLVLLMQRTLHVQRSGERQVAQYQDRAARILQHVTEAIVVTNGLGVITDHNDAAAPVLSSKGLRGSHCSAALALRSEGRTLDCSTNCALLEISPDGRGEEVWRKAPDGSRQPLLASALPVPASDGMEVVHTLRDITSLKEAEEAKSLLLATTSHELKSPLTVIRGFTKILAEDGLDPEMRETALDAITRSAAELSTRVESILLSSRIDAGRVQVESVPMDLAAVVAQRQVALSTSTGRRIEVVVRARPPVLASREAVCTVIDHLVENAVKYSPEDSPVTLVLDQDGHTGLLSVIDEGIGMTESQMVQCFDRFWRAAGGQTTRSGGTGLGLYIVRSIAESMDGAIAVASTLGKGTQFTLSLPRADVDDRPEVVPAPPLEPVAVASSDPAAPRGEVHEFMRQLGLHGGGSQ